MGGQHYTNITIYMVMGPSRSLASGTPPIILSNDRLPRVLQPFHPSPRVEKQMQQIHSPTSKDGNPSHTPVPFYFFWFTPTTNNCQRIFFPQLTDGYDVYHFYTNQQKHVNREGAMMYAFMHVATNKLSHSSFILATKVEWELRSNTHSRSLTEGREIHHYTTPSNISLSLRSLPLLFIWPWHSVFWK